MASSSSRPAAPRSPPRSPPRGCSRPTSAARRSVGELHRASSLPSVGYWLGGKGPTPPEHRPSDADQVADSDGSRVMPGDHHVTLRGLDAVSVRAVVGSFSRPLPSLPSRSPSSACPPFAIRFPCGREGDGAVAGRRTRSPRGSIVGTSLGDRNIPLIGTANHARLRVLCSCGGAPARRRWQMLTVAVAAVASGRDEQGELGLLYETESSTSTSRSRALGRLARLTERGVAVHSVCTGLGPPEELGHRPAREAPPRAAVERMLLSATRRYGRAGRSASSIRTWRSTASRGTEGAGRPPYMGLEDNPPNVSRPTGPHLELTGRDVRRVRRRRLPPPNPLYVATREFFATVRSTCAGGISA